MSSLRIPKAAFMATLLGLSLQTTPLISTPVFAQEAKDESTESMKKSLFAATVFETPGEAPKPALKAAPLPKIIKRISVMKVADGTTVRFDSNQMPTYKVIRLASPERLVLDIDGIWKLRAPAIPNNALVSNVRIGEHKNGTRIVIDLKKVPADIRYLKYGETGLDVRLR